MQVKELKEWLGPLADDVEICIDAGGLALQIVGRPAVYIEIGGDPENDEDSEDLESVRKDWERRIYKECEQEDQIRGNY